MQEEKSSEEKREEEKKAFLDDLKKRKNFLEDIKSKSFLSKVEREMEKLMGLGQEDDSQVWIDKLNTKSATSENTLENQLLNKTSEPIDNSSLKPETLDSKNTKTIGDHEQALPESGETGSLKDTSSRNDKTLF